MPTLAATQTLPEGWLHHAPEILRLLERYRPKICVELGSWMGKSATYVARSVRRWGGSVTCVDTWAGDGLQAGESVTPWMLAACARNLRDAGVAASVRLIPATTREAAAAWAGPEIDYLYIDADHRYEAVRDDLADWLPHMGPIGLIVGDDYDHPSFPGVRQAWDEFEQAHGLVLTRSEADAEGIRIVYGVVTR